MFFTETFYKNAKAKTRYIFNEGGSGSGKTYGEIQKEVLICMKRKTLTSCMSESVPHLKGGMIRDFLNIMQSNNLFESDRWHKTDSIYTFSNESQMEFFSADNAGKVHGPRRDRLLVNEANNIPFEIFRQASMRTRKQITADYNPKSRFYIHSKYIDNPEYKEGDDFTFIHSTYLDNQFLDTQIIDDMIKQGKNDPNYNKVYLLGLVGSLDGLIFPTFNIVDNMPTDYKRRVDGQDYGFTNDPTTHIDCRLASGELWFDELIYEKGLVNLNTSSEPSIELKMIKAEISKSQVIIGDSAEPKTIRDLRNAGYRIKGAMKGKDSIIHGIKTIKQYPINVTKRSVNIIKELRNYQNIFDKNTGEYIDKPIDKWNHCIDAMRYAVQEMIGKKRMVAW